MVRLETFSNDGLRFEVSDFAPLPGSGERHEPVICLHGFPSDRFCWDGVAAELAKAGYRTLAPDQRGYSPGARPAGRANYKLDQLAGDVLALADATGVDRFHVVGHDWGAVVAWYLAVHHPDRVSSLTALSVPHTGAFLKAMATGPQLLHSWYMLFFQIPRLPELLLGAGQGKYFERVLQGDSLDEATARRYADRARDGALTTAINWYRALPLEATEQLGRVKVPTLFVWSEGDRYVTRKAAEACSSYVTGPYRYEVLPGSHWLPEVQAERVSELLVEHLRAHGQS